jgi:hypothetical protein
MVQHSLDSVCREWLIEKGESNMNRFAKVYQIAVSGLREINMDDSGTVSVAILPCNLVDQVNLPVDFVSLIRLSMVDFAGNLQALTGNDNIAFASWFDSCGNPVKHAPQANVEPNGTFWNGISGYTDNFRNGEATGRMFGVGGGNNVYGTYRVDRQNGTIVFGNLMANVDQVVLEYLADLSAVDGKYLVHPFMIASIKAYISWMDINDNDRKGLGDKQMKERQFYNAEKQMRRRFQAKPNQDWLSAFRFANKAAVKW